MVNVFVLLLIMITDSFYTIFMMVVINVVIVRCYCEYDETTLTSLFAYSESPPKGIQN